MNARHGTNLQRNFLQMQGFLQGGRYVYSRSLEQGWRGRRRRVSVGHVMPASALPPFEVSCAKTAEDTVLTLRGELDMSSAPLLVRELEAVEAEHPRQILLDLAELSFMDVTGLRTILDAARRARRAGRAFVIANPLPHIIRLLELTAIDQTVEVLGRPLASLS